MSTARPRLAPIFRSETQLRVLGATYLEPERRFSMPELVDRSGRPQPTVAREVDRLVQAGLLETELRSGRRSVWAASESVIFQELQSILLKTIGPKAVIEHELLGLAGVERAVIYGSWARRYHGEAGAAPNDVDLLVIGSPAVSAVRDAAERATRRLGQDVNATVLSSTEWNDADGGFISAVKASPLVDLDVA